MLKKLSLGTKLFIGCLVLVSMTLACMGGINVVGMSGTLTDLGQAMLTSTSKGTISTLSMQNGITQEKIDSDLVVMDKELGLYGRIALDEQRSSTMDITNQVTKKTETVTIPILMAGTQDLTQNFTIVDNVQATVGGTATIFQVLPGKLLRVSTNVRKLDGERATGTYIPESSPVYKTVMRGETFRGKAFVVNDWFLTAYKPVRDAAGTTVAVVYVGRKIMTPQLEKLLSDTNVAGKGFASVFNGKGDILLHPAASLVGTNISALPFGQTLLNAVFASHP